MSSSLIISFISRLVKSPACSWLLVALLSPARRSCMPPLWVLLFAAPPPYSPPLLLLAFWRSGLPSRRFRARATSLCATRQQAG
jgi:hypothetical protein